MDQLIRYRYLVAELATDELEVFRSTLPDKLKSLCSTLIDNTELIISSIFNELHKQIQHNKDLSTIKTINKNIANIIKQRLTLPKAIVKSKPIANIIKQRNIPKAIVKAKPITNSITFNTLSSALINEIGSYLLFNEIIKMEIINRICFLSLRYPYCALTKVTRIGWKIWPANWMEKYCKSQQSNEMPLDFQQFKSLNELWIGFTFLKYNFHKLGRIFNKIKYLGVSRQSDIYGTLEQILGSNICNFESIKALCLPSWQDSWTANSYLKIILMSKQLKRLELVNLKMNNETVTKIKINMNAKQKEIKQQLSQLEVFLVRNIRLELYKPILDITSDQILSLHIDDSNALNDIGYKNVQEFCFRGPTNNITIAINKIMKSTKHLQKIAIITDRLWPQRFRLQSDQKMHEAITNLLQLNINSLRIIVLNVCDNEFLKSNILNTLHNVMINVICDINNEKSLEIAVIGIDNPLSNEILKLSFLKTLKLCRPNFSLTFIINKKPKIHDEKINQITNQKQFELIKHKMSKIATISKIKYMNTEFSSKDGYRIYNAPNLDLFNYKQSNVCCFCDCYNVSTWHCLFDLD